MVTNSASTTIPPVNGSNLTRSRNKRRKESKRLSFIKSKGILPAAATKADLYKFEKETTQAERQQMIAVGAVRAAFEAKRQDLLISIAAGGIDVSVDPSLQRKDAGIIEDQVPRDDPLSKATTPRGTVMTDQPASAKISGKVEAENPSANDPISTTDDPEFRDSGTISPSKAKETPRTDSISTTATAIVPDSITTSPVETTATSMDDAGSTIAAVEARGSRTTPAPDSQHRQSKLDVSGARRMLFSSLGLRTPKTKDDEMKMREKLMKDVRPIKQPQVNDNIEKDLGDAAVAEDESWKDKIDLRAVECCYEGIELSTPPFPFIQRWDPQQQRGYSIGNSKKRNGKKRKRNNNEHNEDSLVHPQDKAARRSNPKNHEDSSYTLHKKAVRLNEDDWPRQEAERKPTTEKANAESKDQERPHDENLEDSIKANEQLLHETEDASADTLVEMEETDDLTDDLPTLPEDLSIYSYLTLDTAAKGTIVAFKQLEMSAETNWQPKISEYRTAIVDEILEDGTLSMMLAKRDQPSENIQYDEQSGERLYTKFEMPGYYDENSEDNHGKIEISFDELINPILVDAAGQKGNEDDVVAHFNSNDKAVTQEAHDTDAGAQVASPDGLIPEIPNEEAAEPSEEARQEISDLIKDAGWRSSVHSEVNHDFMDRQDEGPPGERDDHNEPALVGTPSPKFQGFSSSPHTNGSQVASSPPPAALQTSKHMHASRSEIAESVPRQGPGDSPARSIIPNRGSAIDYPDLPQINDDSEVFQQEAQDRSGLLEADHQILSQDVTQDITSPGSNRRSPSQSIASPTLTLPEKSSPRFINEFDGADSDESLPELFSQAFEKRMSQGREIKSELSEEDPISPPSHRKSKRNSRMNSSKRESNRDREPHHSEGQDEDDGASTPRPSQSAFSSQIVDLTISSDTVDPLDDSYNDDDSYVLPTGPGWIRKARISESRHGPTKKTTTRGSMRSR